MKVLQIIAKYPIRKGPIATITIFDSYFKEHHIFKAYYKDMKGIIKDYFTFEKSDADKKLMRIAIGRPFFTEAKTVFIAADERQQNYVFIFPDLDATDGTDAARTLATVMGIPTHSILFCCNETQDLQTAYRRYFHNFTNLNSFSLSDTYTKLTELMLQARRCAFMFDNDEKTGIIHKEEVKESLK